MDELQKQIENLQVYLGAEALTIVYHPKTEKWDHPAFFSVNIHMGDRMCSIGTGATMADALHKSRINLAERVAQP